MHVLVTGGAGFIGSHYVRSAIEGRYPALTDAEITVIDKLSYAGNLANLDPVMEDVPRLVELRWRSGVNLTRRSRQFRVPACGRGGRGGGARRSAGASACSP